MIDEIRAVLSDKRILITGHTGFKGSWLALWLTTWGADVHGLALEPPSGPTLFDVLDLTRRIDHGIGDIRDYGAVRKRIEEVRPDVVIHMAAQSLVRLSYAEPLQTFATNAMGTAHVLEAVRAAGRPCAVVVVSSDKCYANHGWSWGYRESDPLGGDDPYSASKGATELIAHSWRASYFATGSPVRLASARAGNVIGGGDWATDRIIPDCVHAFASGQPVELRSPGATRPWQHVLEPLSGYLLLAARLLGDDAARVCQGWNFGPEARDVRPVRDLVDLAGKYWGDDAQHAISGKTGPKEAHALALCCDMAANELGWLPVWRLETAVCKTIEWYRAWNGNEDMAHLTVAQIADFEEATRSAWRSGA